KGRFYPADLPRSRMLEAYARRFPTVEINATFYRLPAPHVVATWRDAVPGDFRFAVKAPQRITHLKRLLDCEDLVARFYEVAAELRGGLGPVLFQLHPGMKADVPRLRAFLALLPHGGRAAFEFRHPSWFDDAVYVALADAGAALCVADTDDGETPTIPTAGFGYLRLRRAEYDLPALARWRDRILAQRWQEAFVFFKHEDEARGPVFATAFALLGEEERAAPDPGHA
ncbi:MAG TPA: DUF72 domain-containing protein, partial [Anaeromyxobacteraceae bacterium]|nr:DUF72 domain-containing protein [Anaeromyxobacteraceae bacterium]